MAELLPKLYSNFIPHFIPCYNTAVAAPVSGLPQAAETSGTVEKQRKQQKQ
ncbi:MAG TPA: hypothetical protein H9697_00540 [Candidatus Mediterraneibacter faecavium]|uniref:Uncharacterized protein n=1 Tax=Candidatus Mediterraneibacter faecavium TaxID=2838668 RepID=A0A9D2TKH8_9FIRM|nr:hypothetical protein [Candidatus Mediterraneibacter faecavium]